MNMRTLLTILRLVIAIAHVSIGQSSNVGITDNGIVISVAVNPSIALAFRCSSSPANTAVPCGDGASYEDLLMIATAAEAFIHNSKLVQLGLEFDTGDSIIEENEYYFEGVDISASTLPPNSSDDNMGRLRGRNIQDDDDAILLSGMFHFRVPLKLSPLDQSIPSESFISQILLAAFVREEDAFLVKLREVTDNVSAEKWLNTVVGYNAQIGGSEFVMTAYGRQLQEANPDDVVSDSGNSSSFNNIWLIVGAAGAAVSLLLLCGGLCYARKSFKVEDGGGGKKKSPTTKGDDVIFQPGKNNPKSSSKLFKKNRAWVKALVHQPPCPRLLHLPRLAHPLTMMTSPMRTLCLLELLSIIPWKAILLEALVSREIVKCIPMAMTCRMPSP
jgi:hypothetical protein